MLAGSPLALTTANLKDGVTGGTAEREFQELNQGDGAQHQHRRNHDASIPQSPIPLLGHLS